MQRPVKQRGGHRGLNGLGTILGPDAGRRGGEVRQRLGDAEEHQADAHAGTEHHRDPRDAAELGFFVVAAERDIAVAAQRQPQHEDHESRRGEYEQPTGVVHHPGQGVPRGRGQGIGADEPPDQEGHRNDGGDAEHNPAEAAGTGVGLLCDRDVEDRMRDRLGGGRRDRVDVAPRGPLVALL